jgi:hypothetical protein
MTLLLYSHKRCIFSLGILDLLERKLCRHCFEKKEDIPEKGQL